MRLTHQIPPYQRSIMAALGFAIVMLGAVRAAKAQPDCVRWEQRGEVSMDWLPPRASPALAYDRLHAQTLCVGGEGLERLNDTWGWDGNAWTLLSEGPFSARLAHFMAYDTLRETMVLFGGADNEDTWERGPSSEWRQVATTGPSERVSSAMVFDSRRGVMVLFGGYDRRGFNRGDTWEWDGVTWTLVAEAGPSARRAHAMAYDSRRGVTVLHGGYASAVQSDTWEWDGQTWTRVDESGLGPRDSHKMVFDEARGVSLLFGGSDGMNQTFGDLWSWNGSEWTLLAPSGPGEHADHRMAYDSARGVSVLIGGGTAGRNVWEWDGAEWSHYFPTDLDTSSGHAMVYDPVRRRTVMFGGYTSDGLSGKTWEWDGQQWMLVSETGPSPRAGHAMVYDTRRHVVVLFGGSRVADLWEWDGEAWTEIQTIGGPSGRSGHAMAYDSRRGEIVVVGGYGSGFLRDTWAYRDGQWRSVTDGGPSPRTGARMVYDAVRDNFVLYGGYYDDSENYYTYDQTWILGAHGWRVLHGSAPGPLVWHAMTFDPDRGAVLMHGGSYTVRDDTLRDELWQWDGAAWSLVSNTGPSARMSHAITYDTHRHLLVLFGGSDNELGMRGDTWEFGHIVAPTLVLQTSCPQSGPASLSWSCASTGGVVGLGFSPRNGLFRIPGGRPCAGMWLGLHRDGLRLLGLARSNQSGSGSISGSIPANACGGYIQLIDVQTCATSEVERIE